MINTHIEFAHIYQDKFIEEEQINSISILKRLNLCKETNTFSILVDDYNLKEKKWNNSYLIEKIKEHNIPLDFIFFESKFKNKVKDLINKLPKENIKIETFKKEKKKVIFYKKNNKKIALKTIYLSGKEKYSCIALSTCWKLSKLGYFKFPENSYMKLNNKSLNRNNTITILPKKYKKIEDNVCVLIKEINNNILGNIKYIYY